jgi:anti-sigma B factor antagonist
MDDSDGTRVIRMAGDLDLASAGQLSAALDRLDLGNTRLLVLDLQELGFLDLAGLRAILRVDGFCKGHGIRFKVIRPRGFASRIFTLTSVHRGLELVDPPAATRSAPTDAAG